MMICGNCKAGHHEVSTVRACYAGNAAPCTWLVSKATGEWNDFEPLIVPCGATAVIDERGFRCEAGHEHVDLQVRLGEGWDYAGDEAEAAGRASYGYDSRLPDGHIYLP